jgi:hypothetical protein
MEVGVGITEVDPFADESVKRLAIEYQRALHKQAELEKKLGVAIADELQLQCPPEAPFDEQKLIKLIEQIRAEVWPPKLGKTT